MPFGIGKAVKKGVKKAKRTSKKVGRSKAYRISKPVLSFVGDQVPAIQLAKAVSKSARRARRK